MIVKEIDGRMHYWLQGTSRANGPGCFMPVPWEFELLLKQQETIRVLMDAFKGTQCTGTPSISDTSRTSADT